MPTSAQLRFGAIDAPFWEGAPTYIIGGGPSAARVDFDALRARPGWVLACNGSMLRLPWAHAVASIDRKWINEHAEQLQAFAGEVFIVAHEGDGYDYADVPRATVLRRMPTPRGRTALLSANPREVSDGGHTGYAAINIAVLKRATNIVLVGFDMKGAHWHDGYKWNRDNSDGQRYMHKWALAFDWLAPLLLARGVSVVNASPDSAVTAFPVDPLAVPLKGG